MSGALFGLSSGLRGVGRGNGKGERRKVEVRKVDMRKVGRKVDMRKVDMRECQLYVAAGAVLTLECNRWTIAIPELISIKRYDSYIATLPPPL